MNLIKSLLIAFFAFASLSTYGQIQIERQGGGLTSYEKIVIWAEESGALVNNNAQWSFGNGAVGNIGIPLVEDWELYGFSLHVDVAAAINTIAIDIMDFSNTTPTVIATIATTNQGQANNYIYSSLIPVQAIPTGTVVGFRTNIETGANSDARCAMWLRRTP